LAALGPEGVSLKKIQIKRIYEPPAASDGTPDFGGPALAARGGARRRLDQGCRAKRCASPLVFPRTREMARVPDTAAKSKTITLLFAAKDDLRNNATILKEFLSGGAASQ